jgi:hydroxymethylglutaryl-CoA reductase
MVFKRHLENFIGALSMPTANNVNFVIENEKIRH